MKSGMEERKVTPTFCYRRLQMTKDLGIFPIGFIRPEIAGAPIFAYVVQSE
jgi:hypothetical protein